MATTPIWNPQGPLFADARVVGLLESSHGGSELFTMKHRLIEFLITRLHFSVVAFEARLSGGAVIDDYLRSSKGNLAAALTRQGYTAPGTPKKSALSSTGCTTTTPISPQTDG